MPAIGPRLSTVFGDPCAGGDFGRSTGWDVPDEPRLALVSVVVSFACVLDRSQSSVYASGERDEPGDAPGGRASDDLLSGRYPRGRAGHT